MQPGSGLAGSAMCYSRDHKQVIPLSWLLSPTRHRADRGPGFLLLPFAAASSLDFCEAESPCLGGY